MRGSASQEEGKVRDRVIKVRTRVRKSVHFRAKFCTTLRVRMRQRSVL